MKRKALVTERLGLTLNEPLAKLFGSRIEYGVIDDLVLTFAVASRVSGMMIAVREAEFAANKKGPWEIGVFGRSDPSDTIRLLVETYPNATILMRKEPKTRRRR